MNNFEHALKIASYVNKLDKETVEDIRDYISLRELMEIAQLMNIKSYKSFKDLVEKITYEEMIIYTGSVGEIVDEYLQDSNIYLSEIPNMILDIIDYNQLLKQEEKNDNILIFSSGIITL